MSELIDLEAAKAHLDVETDAWDADIEAKLDEAEGLVLDYITVAAEDLTERQAVRVQAAIKLVLGTLWANRGDGSGAAPRPLNQDVDDVLYGLIRPGMA